MIPLLRLDYLALEEVLSNFDSMELFNLSLLSKRATWVAKKAIGRRGNEHKLSILIRKRFTEVQIEEKKCVKDEEEKEDEVDSDGEDSEEDDTDEEDEEEDEDEEEVEKNEEDGDGSEKDKTDEEVEDKTPENLEKLHEIPFILSFNESLKSTLDITKIGFTTILNHILDMYSPTINSAKVSSNFAIWMETLKFFQSQRLPIGKFSLEMPKRNTKEEINFVLDNLSTIKTVIIKDMRQRRKCLPYSLPIDHNKTSLFIENAHRLKIEQLRTINRECLYLSNTNWEEKDIAILLHYWRLGGMKNLKTMWLSHGYWQIEKILENIPHQKNNERKIKELNDTLGSDKYEFQRYDGVFGCVVESRLSLRKNGHFSRHWMEITTIDEDGIEFHVLN